MSDEIIHACGHYKNLTNAGYFGYKQALNTCYRDYISQENVYVMWEGCRDRVQAIFAQHLKDHGIWFCHRKNTGPAVIAFIKKIETKLKLKKLSEFGKTDHPEKVLWVKPSEFWLENLVRRSFFTLALRAGQNYKIKKDNLLECFEAHKYGKLTMPAVKLFLEGHTFYVGKSLTMIDGWNKLFRNQESDQVKQLLTNKTKEKTNQDDWF
jgi:hypothetical protein